MASQQRCCDKTVRVEGVFTNAYSSKIMPMK